MHIAVVFSDGTVANFVYYAGFCFDGASIPQIFRSIFKANGRRMTMPALIHDGMWACPNDPFGFETSNEIYKQLLEMFEVWGIWGISKGVNSDIAYERYEMLEMDYIYTKGGLGSKCSITWDDKVLYLDKLQFCRKKG
jgi:hypothetical protein